MRGHDASRGQESTPKREALFDDAGEDEPTEVTPREQLPDYRLRPEPDAAVNR